MGIEWFDLDFKTGETSSSVTPYFMPGDWGTYLGQQWNTQRMQRVDVVGID